MTGNPIPTSARTAVTARSKGGCERCGGRGGEIHHRRSRRVRDEHCHCVCNLVYLCNKCHSYVHAHPAHARAEGFVVSMHGVPAVEPVDHPDYGSVIPTCEGEWVNSQLFGEEKT